jgi:hypothetical protein
MSKLKVVAHKFPKGRWFWILYSANGKELCSSVAGFSTLRALEYNVCICLGEHPYFKDLLDSSLVKKKIAFIDRDRSHQ